MPIHARQRLTAIELEGTLGTAETLVDADAGNIVYETSIEAVNNDTTREAEKTATMHTAVPGGKAATVSLSHHFAGSGTATTAVPWEDLLLACGLDGTAGGSSVDYVPVTGSTNAISIGLQQGGRRKLAHGVMFDLTIRAETGKPVVFQYDGQGCFGGMTNVTALTPTFNTSPKPPTFQGGTFTVGGTALKCSTVEIKLNNQVALREDAAASTGYRSAWIGNRQVTVTLDPEAETTKDFYSQHETATTGALQLICGSTGGNILQIDIPKLQVSGPPQSVIRNGLEVDQLTCIAVQNTSAGDDEITISTK